jgi:hypothetical protein
MEEIKGRLELLESNLPETRGCHGYIAHLEIGCGDLSECCVRRQAGAAELAGRDT